MLWHCNQHSVTPVTAGILDAHWAEDYIRTPYPLCGSRMLLLNRYSFSRTGNIWPERHRKKTHVSTFSTTHTAQKVHRSCRMIVLFLLSQWTSSVLTAWRVHYCCLLLPALNLHWSKTDVLCHDKGVSKSKVLLGQQSDGCNAKGVNVMFTSGCDLGCYKFNTQPDINTEVHIGKK